MRIFDPRFEDRPIDADRRAALRAGSGFGLAGAMVALGLLHPSAVRAEWSRAAFDAKSVGDALSAAGLGAAADSTEVQLEAPEIAENGAVVPVGVTSKLAKTEAIAILVEKNPNMLAAVFDIPAGTEPSITTRIKMAQTCNVYALVKADGRFYVAAKEIKVTLGGCGG